MYKRLLVLLDGSPLAEVVCRYASELAVRLNLNIDLLNICGPDEIDRLALRNVYVGHVASEMLLQIQQIKGKITGGTTEKEIQVKGNVGIGYPAEEILKFADTNQADLIMLSTHGASGIRRWALGNVVDKVIHSTKVPIWLVPSELRDEVINDQVTKRTMVIPLNGSEKAETVLPYALALAKQRGAETRFVLIGVTRSGAVPVSTGESKNYYFNQFIEGTRPDKEVYFQSIIKRIQDAGFEADAEILKGDPPEEIVKYVSTHPTQLIAMATNGASPITEFLFSNVTENVVRRIKKTPIFLVRPR